MYYSNKSIICLLELLTRMENIPESMLEHTISKPTLIDVTKQISNNQFLSTFKMRISAFQQQIYVPSTYICLTVS